MIAKVKTTLPNGKKVTLNDPKELRGTEAKEVALFLRTGEVFEGWVDELSSKRIWLTRPEEQGSTGLPYRLLIGWSYV